MSPMSNYGLVKDCTKSHIQMITHMGAAHPTQRLIIDFFVKNLSIPQIRNTKGCRCDYQQAFHLSINSQSVLRTCQGSDLRGAQQRSYRL